MKHRFSSIQGATGTQGAYGRGKASLYPNGGRVFYHFLEEHGKFMVTHFSISFGGDRLHACGNMLLFNSN